MGTLAFREAKAAVKRFLAKRRSPALKEAWKQEKRMNMRVFSYSPNQFAGKAFCKFGNEMQLLYCSHLLEQSGVTTGADDFSCQERLEVIRLAKHALATGKMPILSQDIRHLLDCFVISPFFNKEPELCSGLVRRVRQLRSKKRERWGGLYNELINIYSGNEAYIWKDWNGVCDEDWRSCRIIDPFVTRVVDWQTCLEAMRTCRKFRQFMICRPPKSIMPHRYALQECIEHVLLWMAKSKVPVYAGVPIAYQDIHPSPPSDLMNSLFKRYKTEVMPWKLQKSLRTRVFLESIGYRFWSSETLMDVSRDYYMKKGANPECLPPPSAILMKPVVEATEEEKLNNWFLEPTGYGRPLGFAFRLHRDAAARAGCNMYSYYEDSFLIVASDDEEASLASDDEDSNFD